MEKMIYRIHDIGEVCGGGTPLTKATEYWNGDIPWITPDDLTDYKYVYISNGKNFITKLGLQKSSAKLLPKGTILFSSRAPIGYVAIAKNDICTNQGFKSLIPNERINNLYFYYWIKCNLDYIKLFGSGATFPEISGSRMKRIKVEIFKDVTYQEKVATILNNYDQLIENNNKQIQLLESMAEELYKEWFVRFRNPLNIKKEMGKVSDICKIKSGYAFKSDDWQNTGEKVVKIKDLDGHFVVNDGLVCVNEKVASKAKKFILNKGDLTIAMTGATVGKIGLVTENGLYTNQRVGKFFSDKKHVPFLYCFFRQEHVTETIIVYSGSSSAQPNISGERVERINMPYNLPLIDLFCEKIGPLFKEIENLYLKNQNLIKQRDALLPRLMSGMLCVEGKEVI